MPTYVYRCTKCGHEFDKLQKISDPRRARCPVCRSAAERVITGGSGFLLKGGGFYATDYRSESYKKAAKSEAAGATEGASGSKTAKEAAPGAAPSAPDKADAERPAPRAEPRSPSDETKASSKKKPREKSE